MQSLRISTTKTFYDVPAIRGLPGLDRQESRSVEGSPRASDKSLSVHSVDWEEPCFITGSVKFTHKTVHWLDPVYGDERLKKEIEQFLWRRRIVHSYYFDLNDPSNLATLDSDLHAALEKFSFIAVTLSMDTLEELIAMLNANNDFRQWNYETTGQYRNRRLDTVNHAFMYPMYELVTLHPEHFLPRGCLLTTYDHSVDDMKPTFKQYVASEDRTLREYPGTKDSPQLPPFSFNYDRNTHKPNPFLVVLNADIKFRRYFRLPEPPVPLPGHVLNLMKKTMELATLLYWDISTGKEATDALESQLVSGLPSPQPSVAESLSTYATSTLSGLPSSRKNTRTKFKLPSNASLDERVSHYQQKMSILDPDDERFLAELHRYDDDHLMENGNQKVESWLTLENPK